MAQHPWYAASYRRNLVDTFPFEVVTKASPRFHSNAVDPCNVIGVYSESPVDVDP